MKDTVDVLGFGKFDEFFCDCDLYPGMLRDRCLDGDVPKIDELLFEEG